MYKRKKEIKALDLLKEINEYRRNQSDIYDTKTLNIKEYENPKRLYNTKTIKTCITSYKDNDSINKEIKKKKNIGRLDLCSHRNKDIFFEVDSQQYDSGNNSKESFDYRKNKCSKLLINKITPYISEHYLTQNNINPYYSIKTYNNYNIRKPFNNNNNERKINIKKRNIKENIENEIIPYKIHKNKKSNNLSFNSSNDKIKYPFVISLKSKNNNHIQKNSNLSNYFNDEINDYFDSFTENSNFFDENEDNNNKNYYNYTYNNINNEKNSFEKNSNTKQTDYKKLYLIKKKQFDGLLKEFNDMLNKLNTNKNNYMINNFKKLNRNRINNKMKKEFNKGIEIIHNINVFYDKKQKMNEIDNLDKKFINNKIPTEIKNENLKIFKENQFEIKKILKNKIHLFPINISQIKLDSNNFIKNKYIVNKIENIKLISEIQSNRKNYNKDNFVINKIKHFKILSKTSTTKLDNSKTNSIINFIIDNNISININQNFSQILNNKYIMNKFNFQIIPDINKLNLGRNKSILANNKEKNSSSLLNKENKTTNNISINLSDILDEINTNNLNKIKNGSIKNKNKIKEKREIVEYNIDRILNQNNENNNKDNIIQKDNNNIQNYNSKGEFNFLKEEIMDLPDLSYIKNKLKISIIKIDKINENELNNI